MLFWNFMRFVSIVGYTASHIMKVYLEKEKNEKELVIRQLNTSNSLNKKN